MISSHSFLAIYSGAVTIAFAGVVLVGARKPEPNDGSESNVFFAVNDDDEVDPITPELAAEWQRIKAMPSGPERTAAVKAMRAKHPGSIVNRGLFGRGGDKAVTLQLKDPQGRTRLVARVDPDGTPKIDFLDEKGKVVRTIGPKSSD